MEPADEWFYSELLKHLKEREERKDEEYYRPLELELPLTQQPIGDEQIHHEETKEPKDRGVIIVDL